VPQIWPTNGYTKPAGVAQEIDAQVGNFLQNPARDALGIIDDDTYFELLDFHHQRLADVAQHLTSTRAWDLLFIETHASDYTSHFFLGQAEEFSGANPETVQRCRDGVARTYASIDGMIGRMAQLADEETVIAVVSDHGGTPNQHKAVDIAGVLEEAGFLVYKEGENGREIDWSRTRAVDVGLVHVFINLKGREPDGIVDPADYKKTQLEIITALHAYQDPETGLHPFALALTHEDAEMLNLWSELVGDVVYALRPEFDGAHGKQLPSVTFGMAGQHCTFVLSGAGVRQGVALQRQVRAVDVAPTLCYLLGMPMPKQVEGGVVYEALEDPDWHLTALGQG
jgi:predicted AlkP superfamily phosphohydrolase/phosphomutase